MKLGEEELKEITRVLASEEFQGRFPGTVGEQKTIEYLSSLFHQYGILPGNQREQTFTQSVPLVELKLTNSPIFKYQTLQGQSGELTLPNNISAFSVCSPIEDFRLENAEMIFIGFGIDAPEYDWNDYKDIDVRGKVVIALVSDPGCVFFSDDNHPYNSLCEKKRGEFERKKMTYYGRWKYKFEEAKKKGARGIFVVHNAKYAGYPWSVASVHFDSPYIIIDDELNTHEMVEGWIAEESIKEITGKNFEELAAIAFDPSFKPFPIASNCSLHLTNSKRSFLSNNIVGYLPSPQVDKNNEKIIVYSAHWDHLGVNSHGVHYGARDNALSVAAVISLAAEFQSIRDSLKSSIFFFISTAEEQGLLGAEYYCSLSPLFPLSQTVAMINMDMLNVFGKTNDISFYGLIPPPFEAPVKAALLKQGRYLSEDPNPGNGMYYRSDHWKFVKVGVPSLFINMGFDPSDPNVPRDRILKKNAVWTNCCYHKPTDRVFDSPFFVGDSSDDANQNMLWDLHGALDDISLIFDIGLRFLDHQ